MHSAVFLVATVTCCRTFLPLKSVNYFWEAMKDAGLGAPSFAKVSE